MRSFSSTTLILFLLSALPNVVHHLQATRLRALVSAVGDKTSLGSELRGGLNTLRLKQTNTQCIQEITHSERFVISLIHRHYVEHLFIEKKKESVVTASVHVAHTSPS